MSAARFFICALCGGNAATFCGSCAALVCLRARSHGTCCCCAATTQRATCCCLLASSHADAAKIFLSVRIPALEAIFASDLHNQMIFSPFRPLRVHVSFSFLGSLLAPSARARVVMAARFVAAVGYRALSASAALAGSSESGQVHLIGSAQQQQHALWRARV